jgi:methanethiol S-methyltransferase
MGAALFVLSLSYFVYSYWTVFGVRADGPLRPPAVLWNVVLFSVFALHHSVCARERIRHALTQALGPLERSFYVWLASLLFIAVCWLWQPLSGVIWDVGDARVGGATRFILLFLQIGGISFSVYSAAALDVWELAGIRQLKPAPPEAFEFKTTGPYGLVRHPIYFGWFLIVFAVGTMTMTRFVFAVVSCVYLLLAIPFEERSLRRSTNGAYDRYMQRVPRKLVPGLY